MRMFKRLVCWITQKHRWVIFADSHKNRFHRNIIPFDTMIGTLAACGRCGLVRNDLPTDEEDAKYKGMIEGHAALPALEQIANGLLTWMAATLNALPLGTIPKFFRKASSDKKNAKKIGP